jgi:PAS domain S-box-containing protein
MFSLGTTSYGIIIGISGLVLLLLAAPLGARYVARKRKVPVNVSFPPIIEADLPPNENAVLIVQPGGRVIYINDNASEWFNITDNAAPNLERMARLARPSESFLSLCSTAGQARFNLQQTFVEGTSYFIPFQDGQAIMVVLEKPQLANLDQSETNLSAQAINIFTDISQKMSASLDLDTTIETILSSVDQLIPSDFSEITLWEQENLCFTPYRYLVEEDGVRRLKKSTDVYNANEGYTGYLSSQSGPLLIDDVSTFIAARPAVSRLEFPFRSFLGIPLKIAGKTVGTIELASQLPEGFTDSDKEVLEILAGHAVIALQNAITHHREQVRAREMTGLAELARVGRALGEGENIYGKLLETISPLVEVEILGFLIHNPATNVLEGKNPFQGLPDQFTELYRSNLAESEQGQTVWEEQDVIITDDFTENSPMGAIGLAPLAQAAAMRETVLVPLSSSGGVSLGYLQAANKTDGSRFNDEDLRLLRIIAGQVAPILENAALIQESRLRAQRAETLRRIASLAGSDATADEILKFSILEINRYLQADVSFALLLDDDLGIHHLDSGSAVGLPRGQSENITRQFAAMIGMGQTVTETMTPLLSNDILIDPMLPRVYQSLQPQLPETHSLLIVPLIVSGRAVGELIVGSRHRNHFEDFDVQLLTSAANQVAGAMERTNLLGQTDQGLKRRVEQLTTLNRLTRQISSSQSIDQIIQQVFSESLRVTRADSAGVFLLQLGASTDAAEEITVRYGRTPEKLTQLDVEALKGRENILIEDFSHSRFIPEDPKYKSALFAPITHLGQPLGLIRLFSTKIMHFDQPTNDVLQSLATQTGFAISNLLRFQEASQQSTQLVQQAKALKRVLTARKELHLDRPLGETLGSIAKSIQTSTQFNVVLIYTYNQIYKTMQAQAFSGLSQDDFNTIADQTIPWDRIHDLTQPRYKIGRCYFIPFDEVLDGPTLVPEFAMEDFTVPEETEKAWFPGDRLIMPFYDSMMEPLGVIALDSPQGGMRPNELTVELLELYASEATLLVDANRKYEAQKLELLAFERKAPIADIEEAAPLPVSQQNLAVLLHKDLEQTIALQQLYHRARNIRVGLDIAETINRQPDRESVLNSLASQMLTEMELDIALVAEPSGGGPRLVNQFGPLPENANPEALLGQRNPLRQTFQSGETIFVPNLEENQEWQNAPLLRSLNAKAFISLPIASNGTIEAAVLAISNTPLSDVTKEDEQVYTLIGNQVSITLQNLNLLTETRRRLREVNLLLEFSRELGSLDPQEILDILVNSIRRVLPHAHGARIILWDDELDSLRTEAAAGYTDNAALKEIAHLPGVSLVGRAYQQGQTLNAQEVDFANDFNLPSDHLLRYREATGGRLPVSALLVPIKVADGTLGVVELDNFNTTAAFSPEDQALIESLTQQIALALENARLFAESRQLNEELEARVTQRTKELAREHQLTQTLLQISTELSSSLDLDMVLNRSLSMLNEATGSEQSTIVIIRPPERNLIYRAGAGIHQPPPTGGTVSTLKIGEGLAGWVIDNREAAVIPDLMLDDRWKKDLGVTTVYRSSLTVPLIVGQDALGCLMLYHRQPNHFRDEQITSVQAAANQFAVTINNGELFQLIRDQAEDLGNMLRAQQIEASRSTAMLEGVGDGVLVTDNQNTITLFNDAAEQMLEINRDQIIGQTLDSFTGFFGSAAQSWMNTIQSWSRSETPQENLEMYTERIVLEDGRVISVHISPVSSNQEFLGTISIFRDITHQVEVDRLKSEFVATVSHELRTPMTPIKGYIEFLLMGGAGELNEQQLQFVDIIKSNVDRLSILVNDLLDVSRIEAGKVALSFQPINLQETLDEVIASTIRLSQEESRPVTIDTNMPDEIPSIYGDPERVRQIFSNLLDNAYKYSPEDSTITVDITTAEDHVQIEIRDQGIGIFPDEQEKIFERFYRGENYLVMATAGTGLGLPIVKELVEMHNGELWLTSTGVPGEGSTFSFTLPIYQEKSQPEDES